MPAMQEIQVRSLGWKDPLEKGMATHSSILAWRISWTQVLSGLQSIGFQRVRYILVTNAHTIVNIRNNRYVDYVIIFLL